MADYICHKSVAPGKIVPKAMREWFAALAAEGVLHGYSVMPKYDGCQGVIFLYADGRIECKSRTGEDYVSFMPAARDAQQRLRLMIQELGGIVLFGEVWRPHADNFHAISGDFRRGEECPSLGFMAFDTVTIAEFERGHSARKWEERTAQMVGLLDTYDERPDGALPFAPGTAYRARTCQADPQVMANDLVRQGGFDGAVAAYWDGEWTKGADNTRDWVKFKAEVALDLIVTNVKTAVGKKTGRPVYTVDVEYRGVTSSVGSGIPHNFDEVPKVGDIIEVVCMAVNKNNTLREPRFKGIRFDKTKPD